MPYVMAQHDDLYNSVSGLGEGAQMLPIAPRSTTTAEADSAYGTRASRWAAVKKFRAALRVPAAAGKEGVYDTALHAAARACLPTKWQAQFDASGPIAIRVAASERDSGTCPSPDDGVLQAYKIFKLPPPRNVQLPPEGAEEEVQIREEADVAVRAPRSQSAVVIAVQRTLRVGADGSYGPNTHAALRRWALSKGVSNFDANGPSALASHYAALGLQSAQEVNVLGNAWRAWLQRQQQQQVTPVTPSREREPTTPRQPVETELPPPPPDEDVWGRGAQEAGFTAWFKNYWWLFAAAAVVGVGGYLIWKRRQNVNERPTLPVPERTTLPMPGVPQEG